MSKRLYLHTNRIYSILAEILRSIIPFSNAISPEIKFSSNADIHSSLYGVYVVLYRTVFKCIT